MKEYKVVPCQGKIVGRSESASKQIIALGDIIAHESIGGWQLLAAMPIVVASSKRRFKGTETPYNALVFARDIIKDEE